jgi:hypothetical protein
MQASVAGIRRPRTMTLVVRAAVACLANLVKIACDGDRPPSPQPRCNLPHDCDLADMYPCLSSAPRFDACAPTTAMPPGTTGRVRGALPPQAIDSSNRGCRRPPSVPCSQCLMRQQQTGRNVFICQLCDVVAWRAQQRCEPARIFQMLLRTRFVHDCCDASC